MNVEDVEDIFEHGNGVTLNYVHTWVIVEFIIFRIEKMADRFHHIYVSIDLLEQLWDESLTSLFRSINF